MFRYLLYCIENSPSLVRIVLNMWIYVVCTRISSAKGIEIAIYLVEQLCIYDAVVPFEAIYRLLPAFNLVILGVRRTFNLRLWPAGSLIRAMAEHHVNFWEFIQHLGYEEYNRRYNAAMAADLMVGTALNTWFLVNYLSDVSHPDAVSASLHSVLIWLNMQELSEKHI